jgi:hypothetical protein
METWVYQTDTATSPNLFGPVGNNLLNAPAISIAGGARLIFGRWRFMRMNSWRDRWFAGWIAAMPRRSSHSVQPLRHRYFKLDHLPARPLVNIGDSVYLSGVPGLATGYYTLLPARYALLPGAWPTAVRGLLECFHAITGRDRYQDIPLGTASQADGSSIAKAVPRLSAMELSTVEHPSGDPGSVVRTQSQYTASFSSQFFTDIAIAGGTVLKIAADAGQLQLRQPKHCYRMD